MTVLVVCGVVVLVLLIFQRRSFMRILTALGAQFGKLSRMIWSADPTAVYQAEVDRAAEEICEGSSGLEEYKGLVTRIQRKVAIGDKEVARLESRIKAYLTNGDENKAAEYAVLLKKTEADLIECRSQLEMYTNTYENNLKKIKFARQRVEQAKEKARRLDADLRLSRVEAETAKLAEKFNVRSSSLEGLGEIEDEIQRQIDTNRGKAQVMSDLSADGLAEIAENEILEKQEAAEILQKYKSELGLTK